MGKKPSWKNGFLRYGRDDTTERMAFASEGSDFGTDSSATVGMTEGAVRPELESPGETQVFPGRVDGLNEVHLLGAPPSLDLLLALECRVDVVRGFAVDESMGPIALAESWQQSVFVFVDSARKVAGHSRV